MLGATLFREIFGRGDSLSRNNLTLDRFIEPPLHLNHQILITIHLVIVIVSTLSNGCVIVIAERKLNSDETRTYSTFVGKVIMEDLPSVKHRAEMYISIN